jgi:hypothetical protein
VLQARAAGAVEAIGMSATLATGGVQIARRDVV